MVASVSPHVVPINNGNIYMTLLALQFAFQPIVTKAFASRTIIKGTYVFGLDVFRVLICFTTLVLSGGWTTVLVDWQWQQALLAAGVPSILYVAQNYFALQAYLHLSPITFNVLNQTKTISAAFWCFVLLQQSFDYHQIFALGLLLLAALVMEGTFSFPQLVRRIVHTTKRSIGIRQPAPTVPEQVKESVEVPPTKYQTRDPWMAGIVPVLMASLLSGLAGALVQRSLQTYSRNSLLLSLELAICSILVSTMTLFVLPTPDHSRLYKEGWWKGWTIKTWCPLILQATGGVLVGLVTKYAGSVRKGFALIAGMFLSGIFQNILDQDGTSRVSLEQWCGGALAALSFWVYTK
jgi:UDP-sugar transporter A1/2/3